MRPCTKEVQIAPENVDSILLERLDKIQKIMEYNGSYIIFPRLGMQGSRVQVRGMDMLHVERTVREVMSIVSFLLSCLFDICELCV